MFTVENARLKSAYFAKKKQISKKIIFARETIENIVLLSMGIILSY
jgi:hypothetical protein